MTDIVLADIGSGYNRSVINNNFDLIELITNDDLLHLTGGNNILAQNIDMNSFRLLNLPDALTAQEPATLGQLNDSLASLAGAVGVLPIVHPRQVGDGLTAEFSTPATGQTDANASGFFIHLDGVKQKPTTDYTISAVTGDVTFIEAPESSVLIDIIYFLPATLEGGGATGTFTSADAKTITVTDGLITSIV